MSLKMPNLNYVQFSGYLGKDPEQRIVNGKTVVSFSIGVGRKWKDKQTGEEKGDKFFLDVTTWEKLAEQCNQLRKGDAVIVSGSLREEKWTDKETQQPRSRMSMTARTVDNLQWPGEKSTNPETGQKYEKKPSTVGVVSGEDGDIMF